MLMFLLLTCLLWAGPSEGQRKPGYGATNVKNVHSDGSEEDYNALDKAICGGRTPDKLKATEILKKVGATNIPEDFDEIKEILCKPEPDYEKLSNIVGIPNPGGPDGNKPDGQKPDGKKPHEGEGPDENFMALRKAVCDGDTPNKLKAAEMLKKVGATKIPQDFDKMKEILCKDRPDMSALSQLVGMPDPEGPNNGGEDREPTEEVKKLNQFIEVLLLLFIIVIGR